MQVNVVDDPSTRFVDVFFDFEKNEDIIELLLFCDAAKRAGKFLVNLHMNYVPFSRQDRTNAVGESFSLHTFATLINSLQFCYVHIMDPHSDVTPALIQNCLIKNQWDLLAPLIQQNTFGQFVLVAPDAGALKKIHKLAQILSMNTPRFKGIVESSKIRNTTTGEITGTVVHTSGHAHILNADLTFTLDPSLVYVIADDICDGGRTFLELAKVLRAQGAEQVDLYVTHGFFTKGMEVFTGLIDHVYAVNNQSKRFAS
jgi:ribose-phosphate pyrophosphokinase